MKIIWSKTASIKAEEISDYIAQDSINEAKEWISQLLSEVERLDVFPELGRVVPNFDDNSLREIIFGNYRIIYEIRRNTIEILTVWHSKRLLNKEDLK